MRKSLSALLSITMFLAGLIPSVSGQNRGMEFESDGIQALAQIDITGPAGSGNFGFRVLVLPNDNIAVVDPFFDDGAIQDVGAVYLYSPSGVMISQLKGTTAGDQIGSGGLSEVGVGNFVALSPLWDNGAIANAGAATWMSGTTGLSGTVSSTNSLVGGTANDKVGDVDGSGAGGLLLLGNGNYLIGTVGWDTGGVTDAGAVTFGLGSSGVSGVVSATNSLVGSTANDKVGSSYTLASADGDYLVISPNWDNGAVADVGAATFGNGSTGIAGAVSTLNSLVGTTASDRIGSAGAGSSGGFTLTNGNFVLRSALWNNGATADVGAVTLVNGTTGLVGTVSSANSLIGATANTQLGGGSVIPLIGNSNYVVLNRFGNGSVTWCSGSSATVGAVSSSNSLVGSTSGDLSGANTNLFRLTNGNYVVGAPLWDNGAVSNAGAVTWGNGSTGTTGTISATNSLVGATALDQVGFRIRPLSDGDYVVLSQVWNNGAVADVGAATWADGTAGGTTGVVSASNSIIGSTANDNVGLDVVDLTNGNYVVVSPLWDNGAVANVGAVTWATGTGPTSAVVSSTNSLIGSTAGESVGYGAGFVLPLTNGNYVVTSPGWDNGGTANVGAVTWGNGASGISGPVSTANSLVGSTANDQVGSGSIRALANGNYIVPSPSWANGSATGAGAVTLGNGATGTVGIVTVANSLVGSSSNDGVGAFPFFELSDGRYAFWHYVWNNGSIAGAGAWTFFDASTVGPVSSSNSVVGNVASGGFGMFLGYNSNSKWAIGKSSENKVTIPGSLPTSARTRLEGRVVSSDEVGIRGAQVTVTDTATGHSVTTVTNNFGRFFIEGLDAGSLYVVSVRSTLRYRFSEDTRSLQLHGDGEQVVFKADR